MLGAMALVLVPLLAVPSLCVPPKWLSRPARLRLSVLSVLTQAPYSLRHCRLVVAALELSTSSPVYFDLRTCRFRRHSQYARVDAEVPTGPDFAARAGAYEPPVLTEEEAAVALAVQQSLDEAAAQPAEPPAAPALPPAHAAAAQLAPAGARGEEAPAGGEAVADADEAEQ
jgi:hypothetical protein